MKKFLLAGIAAAAFASAPALAADMPVKGPAYKSAAPYDPWTGCYIGANTGGAWTKNSFFFPAGVEDEGHHRASGWTYGGQIGCDYQFNNNWVIGIQGMF